MAGSLRRWLGEPLDRDSAAALVAERIEQNRKRLLIIGSLMVVVHALHAWHFHLGGAARAAAGADELRWRDGLVATHLATMGFAAVMAAAARFVRAPRVLRALGPITAAGYLVHGAVISGLDQIMVANISAYIGYALGVAVLVSLAPLEAIVAYAIGASVMIAGLVANASAVAERENLPTVITLTVIAVCLSWFTHAVRRRELVARRTIARQQVELTALNAGLERRVREQVEEIVARAADVERLNAELQGQVRARSAELSQALSRLARQMEGDRGLDAGAVIADRFVVERSIGEGGMGRVYAGVDKHTSGKVAIKVLQVSSSYQLDALRRFVREAGATATISHPAVVRVLALDVSDDGLLYQVQELVEGHTLARRVGHAWAPRDAARVGAVLADALAAAHAQRVIHRDVKPENIMLTPAAPGLKLLDFGIAKLAGAAAADGATQEHVVVGTAAYMAPEQIAGDGELTDRADIYAVGVILHQLVSGALPIEATSASELMLRKLTDEPVRLTGVAPAHAELIARCLARVPASRPSAASLASSLRALADEDGAPPLEAIAGVNPDSIETAVQRVPRA